MKTLEVKAVETLQDKNGKEYSKILLSTADHIVQGGKRIRIEPKTQNIVKYPESYLPDGSPQYGHDLQPGELVAGDIVTRGNLMPYNIVDAQGNVTSQVDFATHVVLGNTDDPEAFEVAIKKEFRSRGKFDNDGTNAEAYFKYWGFSPETGEVAEEETVTTEATL